MRNKAGVITATVLALVLTGAIAARASSRDGPASGQARITISPNMTVAELQARGDELRGQKAYAEALTYYREALRRDKRNAALYNKAGIAELQLGEFDNARRDFERALKNDRSYTEAYNNLGVVLYMTRNYKKAVKQYQKALALEETSASFHSNLGAAYFAQRNIDLAVAEYSRALELDPEILIQASSGGVTAHIASPEDRAYYWYLLAKMYARRGDSDRSLLCLHKALDEGYSRIQDAKQDPEFGAVHKDPRFVELLTPKSQE